MVYPTFKYGQTQHPQIHLPLDSTKLTCLHHTESLPIQVPHQQKRTCALVNMWLMHTIYEIHDHFKQSITLNTEDFMCLMCNGPFSNVRKCFNDFMHVFFNLKNLIAEDSY